MSCKEYWGTAAGGGGGGKGTGFRPDWLVTSDVVAAPCFRPIDVRYVVRVVPATTCPQLYVPLPGGEGAGLYGGIQYLLPRAVHLKLVTTSKHHAGLHLDFK